MQKLIDRTVGRVVRSLRYRYRKRRYRSLDFATVTERLGYVPQVVLEIGANNGNDSLRMLSAFPGADLHCFEPDPRPAAQLEERLQGTTARVYRSAVGAIDGPLTFHQSSGTPPTPIAGIADNWHLSGSLRTPKRHLDEYPWCRFDDELTVDCTRLDTWAEQHGVDRVDFIWADVQGAERDLIEGGQQLLSRTRLLYTEYSNKELYEGQATLRQLKAMLPGWRVVKRFPEDVLFENVALGRTATPRR